MRTLVFQSYRTHTVPRWITGCIETVRDWAAYYDYAYEFIGDELFDPVPKWFRMRVHDNRVPMSDLARLEWAARYLSNRWDRVIWVDADVAIFDNRSFQIETAHEFAFCSETWIDRTPEGKYWHGDRVNNAVSVFVHGNHFLDYYIYACKQLALNDAVPLTKVSFGTGFLTSQHRMLRLPLLDNVGMLSPCIVHDLARGGSEAMHQAYADHLTREMHAGNFCGSFRDQDYAGMVMTDTVYEAALARMIGTHGSAINAFVAPPRNSVD